MPDTPYQMILRCSGHEDLPRERMTFRPNDEAAKDSAARWLRLYRNTDTAHRCYDRWDVYDVTHGRRNRRLVAQGGIDGQRQSVQGGGVFSG